MQRETWVSAYLYQVLSGPGLQAHQHHSHVQGLEELKKSRGSGEGFPQLGGHEDATLPDTDCVQE